ncbi:pilus assembly protein FlpE [Isoptericola sediminis]|uniref:Pilus assembly protein FlpE n=1 Tax=Isoptericola sediminis TaxID=2733572 RepID=A0A849JUM8_9MICO|nr:pilus assembly protein FlpE [Isoptericola sediminis]NNU27012.1 pilus assembly protein FlpE [Isoptericola sediminis]
MDLPTTPTDGVPPVPAAARLVGVLGACGGVGTSLLAAALARALRRRVGSTALVDLDVPGAGLDVHLGIDDAAGARWSDLAGARGTVDGDALVATLPRWGAVPVLSGGHRDATAPDEAVVLDTTTAVLRTGHRVVLDLPRPWVCTAAAATLVGAADAVVLVTPLRTGGVAGALATLRQLDDVGAPHVLPVACRPAHGRVDERGLGEVLGHPVVATVGWDPRLAGRLERGHGPSTGRRAPLGRAANRLVDALTGTAARREAA